MAAERALAVVQARMGSTRLPGKSLLPFAEATVLGHMLDRLRRLDRLDLCVATSDLPEDDPIAEACRAQDVDVFRGPAEDVLARFARCVESRGAAARLVLRVCADRPLLCPELADELLDAYDELGRPDYVANNLPPSWPAGLDLELVRGEALVEADRESTDAYEREHVTPFVYRRPERFRLANLACPFGNYSSARLALDTRDDYDRLVALHARLPDDYDHRDVLTALELAS